jgi:hypothetical protein
MPVTLTGCFTSETVERLLIKLGFEKKLNLNIAVV